MKSECATLSSSDIMTPIDHSNIYNALKMETEWSVKAWWIGSFK